MPNFFDTVINLLTDSLTNCTNRNDTPKSAAEFLSEIETLYVFALIFATLIFLLTIGLFFVQLIFIGRYCRDVYRRAFILFLANTPPFISFFALVAMYMPRVWFLSYLFSFLYFSMSIYITVCLLLQLLDGRQSLVKKMNQTNRLPTFVIQTPPCCCLFGCMPDLSMDTKKIKCCEIVVMQTPLVRLVCTIISLILYFELLEKSYMILKVIEFISLPSLLFGIYGMHVLSVTVSKLEEISHTKYITVFRLVDIFFMIFGLQTPLFELSARAGFLACGAGGMNAISTAYFWKNFAIVMESFLISIIASLLLKPSKTGLFDKYDSNCRSVMSSANSTTMSVTSTTAESVA